MIDLRGRGLLGDIAFGRQYYKDHVPVREAVEATGTPYVSSTLPRESRTSI